MESVKITSFELENVKRVRLVSLTPTENGLTVIGGRNCQGKTSVLDGIAYALGGEKFRPTGLQNTEGMAPARMEVTLSNGLKVTRSGKNAALKVTDPSGAKAGQKLLDSFIEGIALDLPKFLQASAKDKAATLLRCLGIQEQLDALDREENKWFDERTLAGRDADRKKKYAEELPEYPDAPEQPLSAADMSARMTDALAENARHVALRAEQANLQERAKQAAAKLDYIKRQLAEAEKESAELAAQLQKASQPIPEDIDTTAIQAELQNIDAINSKVRTNMDKKVAIEQAEDAAEAVKALTSKVEDVRRRRAELLSSVKMPLAELSVEAGELVYRGQKWDCMSTMEQMVVGTAICRAVKPSCGFVLLDRLETFDAEQLRQFGEWLRSAGMQAIGTRVATDGTCDIIIKDGQVLSQEDVQVLSQEGDEELADKTQLSSETDPLGDW